MSAHKSIFEVFIIQKIRAPFIAEQRQCRPHPAWQDSNLSCCVNIFKLPTSSDKICLIFPPCPNILTCMDWAPARAQILPDYSTQTQTGAEGSDLVWPSQSHLQLPPVRQASAHRRRPMNSLIVTAVNLWIKAALCDAVLTGNGKQLRNDFLWRKPIISDWSHHGRWLKLWLFVDFTVTLHFTRFSLSVGVLNILLTLLLLLSNTAVPHVLFSQF